MNDSTRLPTPAAPAAELVDWGARQHGLPLDAAARVRIAQQVERLQQVMAVLDGVALTVHDEPAPDFVPDAEPAP
ncbi:AtzG-like protein [Thiomonas intermedia]|uniref:AtzG-like protein n=1 Tax=Thiomonas intermedia TaxID=926 RepID=UPI0009A493A7|nr:AtzG-like protein [Thiomonas intermedia]